MRVSEAEYARRYGVSRVTVLRWKRAGHLKMAGRKVEVEASDELLKAAGLPGGNDIQRPKEPKPPKPPKNEQQAVEPDAAEDFLTDLLQGKYGSQHEAERIKENALAGLRTLELQRKAGSVIEVDAAVTAFFEASRAIRDALTAWPSEVGPMLAADLDAPAERVTEFLTTHVRKFLAGLGEPDANAFREAG